MAAIYEQLLELVEVEPSPGDPFGVPSPGRRRTGIDGNTFEPRLWLRQNHGLVLPPDPLELLPEAWEPHTSLHVEGRLRAATEALCRPLGTPRQIIGQARSLHDVALGLNRLAYPHRGQAEERPFDLAEVFVKAAGALGEIPPEVARDYGVERLVAAIETASGRLRRHQQALHLLGLAPPPDSRPVLVHLRAANQWLKLAGLNDKGRAAVLAYLDVEELPAKIAEAQLAGVVDRVRKRQDLARPEGQPVFHPLLGLFLIAWLSSEAMKGDPAESFVFSSSGLGVVLGARTPGPPPRVCPPQKGSPWALVPFPFWAVPDLDEIQDRTAGVRLGLVSSEEGDELLRRLHRLFGPLEETQEPPRG